MEVACAIVNCYLEPNIQYYCFLKSPFANLILRYHHKKVYHQGRRITSGSVRQAGYHIHKGHSVVRKLINSCLVCKKIDFNFLPNRWLIYLPNVFTNHLRLRQLASIHLVHICIQMEDRRGTQREERKLGYSC